jgi:hypothetical protein
MVNSVLIKDVNEKSEVIVLLNEMKKTTITILLFFCGDSFSTNENQSTSKIPLYKIIKKFTPSLSQTSIINLVEVLY